MAERVQNEIKPQKNLKRKRKEGKKKGKKVRGKKVRLVL
jgi:hypothetical protein